ncbi:NAD-dependent epimerase/dehydratase family protein [Epibacterium ulvae]|nr:NAD-dependent epimerase/dehydratase family protein [Epibacterium ulvae]
MTASTHTTILLTGITGFLGGHTALTLLKSGYHVRGSMRDLARKEAVRTALADHGADIANLSFVKLDLTQDDGWDDAAKGTDYMIHVASPFVTAMPRDKEELISPAVNGTERAINAALKAGIKRVVLTSSAVAIVNGRGISGPSKLGPTGAAHQVTHRPMVPFTVLRRAHPRINTKGAHVLFRVKRPQLNRFCISILFQKLFHKMPHLHPRKTCGNCLLNDL